MEPEARDASRRTYLAEERTLLASWRSGLAAFARALAAGGFAPLSRAAVVVLTVYLALLAVATIILVLAV